MIAKVAVSAAPFAIDKPYSYLLPEEGTVLPGMRVRLPFGRGNRISEGIVLQLAENDDSEQSLKRIERVLDEEPILDEKQLRLAAFIRERYFCTFYEAARAILPAGLWFQATETYTIVPDADWRSAAARNDAALLVMQTLEDCGGSTTAPTLRALFSEEGALERTVRYLLAKKLITSDVDLAQRTGAKTERIVSLCVPTEEAMVFAQKKTRGAPLQRSVLELLCTVGSGACKEVCYLTGASMATLKRLQTLGYVELSEREVFRTAVVTPDKLLTPPTLSEEQQAAYEGLLAQMQESKPGVALLYGVTGSGKTAVYIRLIDQVLNCGKSAILLVPEIALTPQLLGKLSSHFGKQVAVLHSSLRVGARYDEWRRIRAGTARVVVGTRSAVFAPVKDLGLILVDEEQEHTYKSENAPRYHAREVAMFRGVQEQALVVLGSATPSIESMYFAQKGVYTLYTMKNRYNGRALPQVELVDMKQEIREGNPASLSRTLEERLRENILQDRQSILFLNRRGNSRCLVCVKCGETPTCPRCSVSLTYHSVNRRLMCHYCGFSHPLPQRCPQCGGALKPVGAGTQRIEEELHYFFPDTHVLRMDADTVTASNNHEAILGKFQRERIPILLGTQMVAKGLDFENVTLVGVVDADMSLYVDNFRAAETTFSLITQVVGRSGRGSTSGTALIQTMAPEHPVLQLAAKQDYDGFYELEMRIRMMREFPPLRDIFLLTFTGMHEEQVMQAAVRFRDALQNSLHSVQTLSDALLLGPSPAPVMKVNNTYRFRLTLMCRNSRTLRQTLAWHLRSFFNDKNNRGVSAFADVNPYD